MLRINLLKKRNILLERVAIGLVKLSKCLDDGHRFFAKRMVILVVSVLITGGGIFIHALHSRKKSTQLSPVIPVSQDIVNVAKTSIELTKKLPSGSVTIDSDQIKLRQALQQIVAASNNNLLIAAPVKGSVAVHLQAQPWRDALNAMVVAFQLAVHEQAHTLFITTQAQVTKDHLQQQQLLMKTQQLQVLQRDFVKVNHVSAQYIAKFIKRQRKSLLGARGAIDVDERGNAIWLETTPEKLHDLKQLIAQLDHPLQQILIKVCIVSVEKTFAKQFGLSLHSRQNDVFAPKSSGSHALAPMINQVTQGAFYAWHVPWLHWAHLDVTLATLQQSGRARVIASPSVITTDHQMATIASGEEIPYQYLGANGGSLVHFKRAVLGLKVTPDITADHHIHLDLHISQDRPSSRQVQGIPAIATRTIHTQVLLTDHDTVVIGGIDEQDQIGSTTQVPGWSHIPLVGDLFKQRQQQHNHTELLLFVTPTIL